MPISLIPLPYSDDALEPHVSSATLQTHHDKHHKAYVDKVNEAIEGTDLDGEALENIVIAAEKKGDTKLFNNAAQAWNHGFYWHSLSPDESTPSKALAAAIDRDFGSAKALREALMKEATDHFASGWAWLISRDGKLEILSTHDAGSPLTAGTVPLLTIDVWEHAYYLDVKNRRPDYVKAVVNNLLNWKFASENYDRDGAWVYPGRELIAAS